VREDVALLYLYGTTYLACTRREAGQFRLYQLEKEEVGI
jgi:hypothetical protein